MHWEREREREDGVGEWEMEGGRERGMNGSEVKRVSERIWIAVNVDKTWSLTSPWGYSYVYKLNFVAHSNLSLFLFYLSYLCMPPFSLYINQSINLSIYLYIYPSGMHTYIHTLLFLTLFSLIHLSLILLSLITLLSSFPLLAILFLHFLQPLISPSTPPSLFQRKLFAQLIFMNVLNHKSSLCQT